MKSKKRSTGTKRNPNPVSRKSTKKAYRKSSSTGTSKGRNRK